MRVSFAAVACAALVLASCTKPEPVPQPDPIPDRAASTVTADPASGVLADGQAQSTVTVTVIDVDGNPMADVQVTLRATGEGVSLVQPTAPTDASGVARGFVTSNKPVAANVSATATFKSEAYELSRQARVEFVPGPAAKLVFAVPPSNAKAGAAIAPPIQVAVQDSLGNTIFDSTAQISLALEANAAGGTLSGTTTVAASSGVATFADLSIDKAAAGYTLVASAAGLSSATSAPIEITVAEPSRLAFLVGPSTTGAGAMMAPEIQVAVQDPLGNLIPTATDVVSLALGNNPVQGTLSGTLSVRAVGGIATFGDLRIDKAGTGYTLAATARNLAGASSESFDVTAAAGTRLVFVGQPTATVAGAPIAPAVRVSVQDDFGNVIASTPTITLALAANTAGAVLAGTMTVTAVDGIATFDDLTITRAARSLSLVATASGLVEGASSAFDVTPAAATRLAFEIQPQNTVAGTVITPAVEIGVHDGFGNRVTTARPQISVAISANPGGATLAGTVMTPASSGLVRFFDLSLDKAGIGYTLVASAQGLTSATSTAFDVGNAAPSQLVFLQQPGNTPAGAAFSPAVDVEVRDRFGNRALTSTDVVTLDLGANPSNGALLGTSAVAAVAGIAHFADLNIDKIGIGYTLVATSGRLSSVTSAPFSIVPAAPAKLAWLTQPTSVAAATAIAPAPRVRILDAYDNLVADATNPVSVELRGGAAGAALSGVATVNASAGVATFSNLKVDKAAAGYSLLATSTGLSGAQSSAFNVGIAPPAALSFKVQPSLSTVNTPFSPAVAVEVRDAGGNLVLAPTAVTVALGTNPSTATLNGTKTVNSASGVAVFADLTISKAGVGYNLVASTTGAPNATSTSFDVRVGGPTGLAFSAQPTATVAGVAIAPALQVSVLDQWGNVVPGATNGVTIAADATSSPGLAGGTLTAFPVNGIATFSNVILEKAGTYKLIASSPGLTDAASVNFVVSVAAPSAAVSTVAVDPAAGVVANGTAGSTITVTVLDAFGNPVSGAAVALSATGTAHTISAPAPTNASGVTTATFTSTKAESKTITATVGGTLELGAHPMVTFVAGAPSASLSTIAVAPATGVVADGLAAASITVTVLDPNGNPVPGATVAVSATGSENLLSSAPATDLDGKSVSTLTSTKAESKTLSAVVTVSATNTPLTSTKPTVTFVPGAPAKLAWQQQPTNVVSATAIAPAPRVAVLDKSGNFVPDATNAVTLELRGGASGAALTGTTSVAAVNGVASFSTLKVDKAATGYSLFASASGLVGAQSSAFDVSIGAPASLAFKVQPRTSVVNTALSPAIEVSVFDAGGNLVQAATPVTIALGTNPTSATLAGTKTISSSAGVAVFANLTISKPGVGYTLAASATGTPGATSTAFTVNVDAPARLAFSVQPTNTMAGNPITPAVQVSVLDTWGNVVPSATGEIVLSSDTASPGQASGTLTATPVNGIATFSDVRLEKVGTYKLVASSPGLTSGTSVNFVVSVAPANATASTITVSPADGVTANGTAISTITVTVRDVFGNPISNATVALAALPSTGNTLSTPANTNVSGVTTATLKSTVAELKTITATVAGSVTLDDRPTITFVADVPSATNSTVTVNPATGVTADGGTFSNITVKVLDAKRNPVPGAAVSITSNGSGDLIAAAQATGLDGITTTTIASTKAGAKTLTTVAKVGLTNVTLASKTVTFVPGPPDANRSSVEVSAASLIAGATTPSTITVTVRDANDNPVPGVAVVLEATPAEGNTLNQPSATTTAAGVATGKFLSTKAEVKTISATAGGVQLAQRPTITIQHAAVSPSVSTAVPSPTTLVADGVATSTVAITALDAYSNPVPAQAVILKSTNAADTFSTPADTDGAGVTSATWAATKAEPKDLTVTIGTVTLTNKPRVTFVPGAPSATESTVAVSVASGVVANNAATSTITVTVKDAKGNPIQDATVALASDGSGDTFSSPAPTSSAGVTTATIKSTKAELKKITAVVTVAGANTTLAAAPTITFIPGAVDAGKSTVEVAPPLVSADGVSLATVTVTALDAYLNPVPGKTVVLTVSGTSVVSAPTTTAAGGTSTATISSLIAEVKTIKATAGGVAITQTTSVEFRSLTVNETFSELVVSPATNVTADGVSTRLITATLRDVNGNLVIPVPDGVLVTFSSDDSADVIDPPSAMTVNGVATATISSTKAGLKTISAVAEGLTLAAHPTVTFVAGPPSASRSMVTATPDSVVADNTAVTTVTVDVRDAYDNPVPGQKPTLSATGSNNTFVQPGTTGASGTVSGTLRSSKAETKAITATLPGTPALVLDQKPTVTFIPGQVNATLSTFTVNPTSGVVADGVAKSTVTVTLKDGLGNLMPGTPVSFAATGSRNSFPTTVTTDANGVAVASLTSLTAEIKTVSIEANGVTLASMPAKTVTFIAGAPYEAKSDFTVSPSHVTADGVATAALVVTVRDAYDNLVPNADVSLRATGSYNKFTPVAGKTTVAGVFGSTLSSTMAEQKQLLASVGGFTLLAQVNFGYTLPQIKSLTIASGGGCVKVDYAVQQSQAKRVDVRVEYDPTGSNTFARATQAGSTTSDGIEQITAAAAVGGQAHSFLWNTTADLPRRAVTGGQIRVTPYINGQAGVSMTQPIESLSNKLTFGTTTGVPAGSQPGAVAQADFNRDGKLDLVTSNPSDDKIYVLLGNGSGGFAAAKPFAAQQAVTPVPDPLGLGALVAADLDRDGDVDVAVAGSTNNEVILFFNNGSGDFPLPVKMGSDLKAPPRPSVSTVSTPAAIVAADLEHDGWSELIAVGSDGARVLDYTGIIDPHGWPVFSASLPYPAGASPSALAAADVNGDGRPDLLVANASSNSVSVMLGNGTGFGAASSFAVGAEPSSLATADLNRDGDLDLVVANRADNTFSLLLGTGTGNFMAGATTTTGFGPAAIACEDLDGDGKLDVVVSNQTENTIGVHLGNGDGTFAAATKPVASGQPAALVVGDYNRDGKLDMAAAAPSGSVVDVLLNTRPTHCDPGFDVATNAPLGAAPQAIASGDFNGDGKSDVAVIDGIDGDLKVLLGTGNGGYRAPLSTSIPGGGGSHFVAADFNGDGKLDVVTPADKGANFFAGAGSGLFSAPVATLDGAFPTSLAGGDFNGDDKLDVVTVMETNGLVSVFLMGGSGFAAPVHLAVGGQPQSATVGDFDRDGKRDLAVVNLANVIVLRGNGNGTFDAPATYSAGLAPRFILTSDFDRDGELDLAVANRDSANVSLLRGMGDGTFAAPVSFATGAAPRWLSVDDLNGDGALDLLVGFGPGQSAAKVLLGNGDGTLRAATSWSVAGAPIAVTAADFDADGKKDLAAAVVSASPRLTTLFGAGDGSFPSRQTHLVSNGPRAVTAGDFDRNGASDLAVSALLGGQLSTLLGSGSGSFSAAAPVTLADPGPSVSADVDRDGILDLLVVSSVTARLSVLLGGGDGSFTLTGSYLFPGSSPAPSALAAGDFDRDGALDVVVANGGADVICFFWGDGSGALTTPQLSQCIVVGNGPESIALGDFDKNGTLDLATANGSHNSVGVLLGTGQRSFQPLRSFPVGDPLNVVFPTAVVAADLNGDGNLDLATANSVGDSLGVLLGSGNGNFSAVVFHDAPGEPTGLFAADLDDNGKTDLIAPIRGSGLAVFSGTGTGSLLEPMGWYLDAHAYSVADFDRDGRLDFAFANTDSDSVGVCIAK